MEDYEIVIITRGRVDNQFFLDSLPVLIRKLIVIVCHPGELEYHKRRWNGKVKNIVEYGKECVNISMARHWLMEYCKKRKIKYVIQIDDNVILGAHTNGSEISFSHKLLTIKNNFNESQQNHIYTEMFSWMLEELRSCKYGIVGISHRSGNNNKKNDKEENVRLFAIWGISVEYYYNIDEKFTDNPYKEDFHIQLAFLTNGIKTCCNNCFTFDKARGANASGGCSIYRNLENVNKGSIIIKKTYPDFVSLIEKDSKNWGNLGGEKVKRLETIIHWKKAYNNSIKKI